MVMSQQDRDALKAKLESHLKTPGLKEDRKLRLSAALSDLKAVDRLQAKRKQKNL